MFHSNAWWARELARREAAWAAERKDLIETICHLADKPQLDDAAWPPPRPVEEGDEDWERVT